MLVLCCNGSQRTALSVGVVLVGTRGTPTCSGTCGKCPWWPRWPPAPRSWPWSGWGPAACWRSARPIAETHGTDSSTPFLCCCVLHAGLATFSSTYTHVWRTDSERDFKRSYLYFDGTAADGTDGFTDEVHIHFGGVFLQLGQHLGHGRGNRSYGVSPAKRLQLINNTRTVYPE